MGPFGKALRLSDAVGTFAIVFVLPEDVNITSGSPRHHRNFLDIYLSQFSHKYLMELIEYQKALKQRNSLLKKLRSGEKKGAVEHLDAWDENLVRPALKVMEARRSFVNEIGPKVTELASRLSGASDIVRIAYKPRLQIEDFADLKGAISALRKERPRDLKLGATFLGPHRDVIDIVITGQPLRSYGSMGQMKTVMIAMKLAALQVLSEHRGEAAILVLDEAFAALDEERAKSLLDLLSGIGQVFLASATMTGLSNQQEMKIFDVAAGTVVERDM